MDADQSTAVLVRHQSGYTDLARTVRESNLLNRRYGWYWSRIVIAVVSFAAVWVGLFWLGNSWFQLVLAAALGVLSTQFGFLGHDAAHRQIFRSAAWNEWTARVLAGVFAGLSYGWWRDKHNRHHAAPNQEGKDPDIAPGAIAFTASAAAGRSGFTRWVLLHQGWLFFPMLCLRGPQPARRQRAHPAASRLRPAPAGGGRARAAPAGRVRRRAAAGAAAGQGLGVHGPAAGLLRHLPGRVLRPQPQGDADRARRWPAGLPEPPGAHVAQRARRAGRRLRAWAA